MSSKRLKEYFNDPETEMTVTQQYKESDITNPAETESFNGSKVPLSWRTLKFSYVTNCTILVVVVIGYIVLISITSATFDKVKNKNQQSVYTTIYTSLGLPGYEQYSWDDVLTKAAGSSVNFWMFSGNPTINNWVDNWLAPQVAAQFDVKVVRIPFGALPAVNQLIAEKQAKNLTNGKVDLVWINGENFNKAKSLNLLYGPFATKLPSSVNFDFESEPIKYDFGRTTNGYEMPYNVAEVVFIYDKQHFPSGPPQTIDQLVTWVQANPGRFTYPAPQCFQANCPSTYDFTGSVFIRHFLYYYPTSGSYTDMLGDFNQNTYNVHASAAFTKLREIQPYLYNRSGIPYYPNDIAESDSLFAKGEIWLTLSYDPSHAGILVAQEYWPKTTQGYVLKSGVISNTNFIAIGWNAKNILGALVVTNFIASIQAQFNRRQPEGWGAIQCYNPSSSTLTTGGWKVAFDYLMTTPQTPPTADLRKAAMPELAAAYTTTMQSDWVTCVALFTGSNFGSSPCV